MITKPNIFCKFFSTIALCLSVNSFTNSPGMAYNVQNIPPAVTASCPSISVANKMGSFNANDIDVRDLIDEGDDAKAIIDHTIPYNINQEVLTYMADQKMYAQLDIDNALRNANTTASTFYTANKYTAIGLLYDAHQALLMANDENLGLDEKIWMQEMAKSLLNQINTTLPYVLLQRDVMLLEVESIRNGLETISDAQWAWVQGIAEQCPAAYGTGVYKARNLFTSHSAGIQYNDNATCNMTANKNSDAAPEDNDMQISSGWVNVYPNPATTTIHIAYLCNTTKDGSIQLFDVLGNLLMSKNLSYFGHDAILDVAHLPAGLYIYKAQLDGCGAYTGKITIK